jgi:hypothetical protein
MKNQTEHQVSRHEIRLSYGETVQFLTSMAHQAGEFEALGTNPLICLLEPEFSSESSQAAATIMSVCKPLLLELSRQKILQPKALGRPADEQMLQLQLATAHLQLLAELGPLCVDTWQQFINLVQENANDEPTISKLKTHRKNCIEGTAGLLQALAEAGVPNMPDMPTF